MKIGDLLTQAVERVPRKPMVIYKGKKYSYRECESIINRFSNGLLGIGIETGSKVVA